MADKDNSDPAYATLEQLMAVDQRVSLLEQRLARIEGILEQMDKRFDDMNRRIEGLDKSLNNRIDDLKNDLRWFMGISRHLGVDNHTDVVEVSGGDLMKVIDLEAYAVMDARVKEFFPHASVRKYQASLGSSLRGITPISAATRETG